MENGICSLREIEKLCRNDIRYMYLLDGMKTPSFATFGNLIRNELTDSIEQIFEDINSYIFAKDHVDLQHTYIDGTKIEANANRYTCENMTTISLRMDDEMKKELDEMCEAMGMNISTFYMVYTKKALRERKIPFEIEAPQDPFYSKTNLEHIRESDRQIKEGKVVVKTMEELCDK